MESEWRFTAANAGMSFTDWRLCARILDGVWEGAYLVRREGHAEVEIWELALFGSTFGDPVTYLLLDNDATLGWPFPGDYHVVAD